MAYNLRNRSFVKELDFTPKELKFLLKLSADLKAAKYGGFEQPRLKGKNIALIFEKSSTRTRCSSPSTKCSGGIANSKGVQPPRCSPSS